MECKHCASLVSKRQRFCLSCGEVVNKCVKCGNACVLEAQFCDHCGNKLSIETKRVSLPSQGVLSLGQQDFTGGIKKHATVLFADVKGSTALIERLDPEEAGNVLVPVIKEMLNAVYHYNGTIIHTAGDGIVAIFGAPQALEDHALRACLSALNMQNKIKLINKDIQIRVGINSGETFLETVGDDQHFEYDIVGPVVSLAARMEQTAKPGTIQLTANTLHLVENHVQVISLGAIQVKGFSDLIDTFELLAVQEKKSLYAIKKQPVFIPFIGRDKEMGLLSSLLTQVKLGKGRAIGIRAESGEGKSRLIYEFIHTHLTESCCVLIGGGISYAKTAPLLAVFNVFRNLLDVSSDEDRDKIQDKVTPYLSIVDSSYAKNIIFSLLGLELDGIAWSQLDSQYKRKLIFAAGVKILLSLATQQPLILLIEDMQWIDQETEAFFDLFLANIKDSAIFFIGTYRPEYQDHWIGQTIYTAIALNPLSKESEIAILDALLGDDTSLVDIKKKLLSKCAGNPFFIEEMIKSLISEKILTGAPRQYCLSESQSASDIHLPESIFSILQMAIERLTNQERDLLQVASIIGMYFPYALVIQLMEIDDKELRCLLNVLIKKDYIYERRIYPETEFAFKHALIQEVAYSGLLKSRRHVLHLKIMHILEEGLTEEVDKIQLVANHAYLGEDWSKAFTYCKRAAEKSFLMLALKSALQLYEWALVSASHLDRSKPIIADLIFIHFEMCQIVLRFGQFEKQIPHLEALMEIANEADDKILASEVKSWYCFHYLGIGNTKEALSYAKSSYAIAVGTNNLDAVLSGQCALVHSYLFLGQYKKLVEIGEELINTTPTLSYYPNIHRIPFGYLTAFYVSLGYAHLGNFNAIEKKKALFASVDINQPNIFSVLVLGLLTIIPFFKGDEHAGDAINLLAKAATYCLEFDITIFVPIFSSWLGCIYLRNKDHIEGKKCIDLAIDIAKKIQFNFTSKLALGSLCEGLLLLGEHERAREFTDEAIAIADQAGLQGQKAWLLTISAEIDLQSPQPQKDWRGIRNKLDDSLRLAKQLDMLPHIGHGCLAYARLCHVVGEQRESKKLLKTAVDIYRRLDMAYWVKQSELLSQVFVRRS